MVFATVPVAAQRISLNEVMPRTGDHTSLWWKDGFPGTIAGAPWERVIQTGQYLFVMNTETLEIPHLGPLKTDASYTEGQEFANELWENVRSAKLDLELELGDKTYQYAGGGKWDRFGGPRLIASGRFVQRCDITNLHFETESGVTCNADLRLEFVAWPDRLSMQLAVRAHAPNATGKMSIMLRQDGKTLTESRTVQFAAGDSKSSDSAWKKVGIAFKPSTFGREPDTSPLQIMATEGARRQSRPVVFEQSAGWHRVDLDGIRPLLPPNRSGEDVIQNDAIERVQIVVENPTDQPHIARLLFAKSSGGIRHSIGSPITGVSLMLRDSRGNPTGIPVQLSKNWHTKKEGGVYAESWLHGLSMLRLPPRSKIELELVVSYGHWGGVAAASHAQLCLIGWGSNQHWSQSALGAWGESICFEPEQQQANCTITDVRPLMVRSEPDEARWRWTGNVGGGDFFRMFGTDQKRIPHSSMKTIYHRHGPCLTEVSFVGKLGTGVDHQTTVSLSRTDELVRGVYRLRMNVTEPTDFSRLVFFQIGADTYAFTREKKMAFGNETGLIKEWDCQWGGDTYRTLPWKAVGRIPWVSLHEADRPEGKSPDDWANRGIVIRDWIAKFGGRNAAPWMAERGITRGRSVSSTLDVLPPPGITRLEPGDFVEMTVEHLVVPQFANEYYGPNKGFRNALQRFENTWKMIQLEARANHRKVEVIEGTLTRVSPDVRVATKNDQARFQLTGGLGWVPVTFTGLSSHSGYELQVNGEAENQSVHGNDYWQTDYDPVNQTWSRTYNIPIIRDANASDDIRRVELHKTE